MTLSLALLLGGFHYATRSVQSYDVGQAPSISYRATNGSVSVRRGRPGKIVIQTLTRADDPAKLSEVRMRETHQGSSYSFEAIEDLKTPGTPNPKNPAWTDYWPPVVDTVLWVPFDTSIQVDSQNIDIEVAGIEGHVRLKTWNGNIDCAAPTSAGSPIEASSWNGKVRIHRSDPVFLTNGLFFDGAHFRSDSWYVVDGFFTRIKPSGNVTTVDLGGKRVVPAYGDAHCHHFEGASLADTMAKKYLAEGTLYAQSMGNHASQRADADTKVNRPDSMDVSYANAGFTTLHGHPHFLYESIAYPTPSTMSAAERSALIKDRTSQLGDAYWIADTPEQLDQIWPRYLASNPSLVKIFLVDTANRSKNLNGLPGTIGLTPEMARRIVLKAHEAGLRVYAHVDTAYDFEVALDAGVDGLAHMPGYGMKDGSEAPQFALGPEAAKRAKGKYIQTTIAIAADYAGKALAQVRILQAANFNALRAAGAKLVIGSDSFFSTTKAEVEAWLAIGIKPLDVLKALSITTPQSIFPERPVGEIGEGFEANFAVLSEDPLAHPVSMLKPVQVYKLGKIIWPSP